MDGQDFVRVQFDGTERVKLRFRHRDLRDAVNESGKSIQELFNDQFGGWPYLIKYAMRAARPGFTLDAASDLIEIWVKQPDPKSGASRTFDDLGLHLLEAFKRSGFLTVTKDVEPTDEATTPEGNAAPEAVTP